MAALSEWAHINCLAADAKEHVHDAILQRLLFVRNSDPPASNVAVRHSRAESLLAAVDLDKILEDSAPPLSVSEVPGGTISFLFERGTKQILGDDEEGGGDEEEELDEEDV